MLCINNRNTDIYFNLAAEEYLLKKSSEDIFMLWQGDASVVVGKHQNVWAEVNLDFVKEKHIHVARRYSGGGTVYHDSGNINLTFIETTNRVDFEKYLRQVLEFLSAAGISARADERMGITVDRLKVSGSAQCIHKNRVMYHCTLLYSTDLDILNTSLEVKPSQLEYVSGINRGGYAVKSVRSSVTNLCEHLQDPPDVDGFKELILDYFLNRSPENKIHDFSLADTVAIEQVKNDRYILPDWIYNKSILKKL